MSLSQTGHSRLVLRHLHQINNQCQSIPRSNVELQKPAIIAVGGVFDALHVKETHAARTVWILPWIVLMIDQARREESSPEAPTLQVSMERQEDRIMERLVEAYSLE